MNLNKTDDLNKNISNNIQSLPVKRPISQLIKQLQGTSLNTTIQDKPAVIKTIKIYDNDLFGTGYIGTAQGAFHIATYWHNNQCIKLTDGNERSMATNIYKHNNNIYVVGIIGENATYWINGKAHQLTHKVKNPSFATDITLNKDNIYIAGHIFNNNHYTAGYWNNNEFQAIGTGNTDQFNSGITIYNNQIIICGYYNQGQTIIPYFWNGKEIIELPIPNQTKGITTGIKVINDVIIITGYYEDENNIRHSCYWQDGQYHKLSDDSTCNMAMDAYPHDNKIYFIGAKCNIKALNKRETIYWKREL